ncbi:MAG: heavy-metal-associated domain-containing protein [Gammaproteobacteria bacterium]|nr:heavy-metal-associated domain-containing protein [Gammaproteobacteria bacterium]NNJ93516.1 heavy-metal-associated domain-containing protein [Halobacteria archaeon]
MSATSSEEPADKRAAMVRLQVEGIGCRGCIEEYEEYLQQTDGVLDVRIDYDNGLIAVQYDPDVIDRRQIYMAARKLVRQAKILPDG